MKKVKLYTDGGCRGNNNRNNIGAIGGILIHPATGAKKEYNEAFKNTTNNKMELLAVIRGLEFLKEPCEVEVYSDSAYIVNAMNQHWIDSWKKQGWRRGKNELKNKEFWQRIDELREKHNLTFIKVKGHSTDIYNNRADELVNLAMDKLEFDEAK